MQIIIRSTVMNITRQLLKVFKTSFWISLRHANLLPAPYEWALRVTFPRRTLSMSRIGALKLEASQKLLNPADMHLPGATWSSKWLPTDNKINEDHINEWKKKEIGAGGWTMVHVNRGSRDILNMRLLNDAVPVTRVMQRLNENDDQTSLRRSV